MHSDTKLVKLCVNGILFIGLFKDLDWIILIDNLSSVNFTMSNYYLIVMFVFDLFVFDLQQLLGPLDSLQWT